MQEVFAGLTRKQRDILDYIDQHIKAHRYSPSYQEIQKHFGFSSLGSVFKYISILKRKGVLLGESGTSRSLIPKYLKEDFSKQHELELPFIGQVAKGNPIETFPRSQTIAIPPFLAQAPEATYVLRAEGNSFQDELIADGDLLLIETRSEPLAGEQILGAMQGSQTLIQFYFPEGQSVRLISRSKKEQVVRQEELTIHGIVVGLLRLF